MFMSESPPQKKRKTGKSRKKFWRVRCPPKQRSHVLWRYPKRWFTIRESSQHPHNICVGEYDGISTHINTNFCIKHPVFLQLKSLHFRLYDPPKTRWILCRFQAHLRTTKRHFSQGLDLEDCLARSKTSLGSTRNYSQDHGEHVGQCHAWTIFNSWLEREDVILKVVQPDLLQGFFKDYVTVLFQCL